MAKVEAREVLKVTEESREPDEAKDPEGVSYAEYLQDFNDLHGHLSGGH